MVVTLWSVPTTAGDLLCIECYVPYLRRHDGISPDAGNAKAVNTVTHMIDPWPRYAGQRHIRSDGARMSDAIERYRNPQKLLLAPPPIAPVTSSGGGAAGAPPPQ